METQTIGIYIFLLLIIFSIIFTVINIKKNKKHSKRQKNNFIFLQLYLPILGAVIYFYYFREN